MRGLFCFLPLIYPLRGYFDGFVSTLSRITAELAGVDTTADTPPHPLLQGDVGVAVLRSPVQFRQLRTASLSALLY